MDRAASALTERAGRTSSTILTATTRRCASTLRCTSSKAAQSSSRATKTSSPLYRDARASSDKKVEFRPKFGDSPLYQHHTTSLVFNDPPLHTRVRRIIMGALQPARHRADGGRRRDAGRAAARRDGRSAGAVDFVEDFAARIPVEVIGNLLDVPRDERGSLRAWSIAILSGLEPQRRRPRCSSAATGR